MTPRLSKFVLTAHILTSVGWLGAVAGFLVLSIASLTSRDAELVRGAYLSMNLIGLYVLVPLSFAALLTGLIQSLGTHWGLFRHYWVLTKLVLTIGAAALLLMHQFSMVAKLARRASDAAPGVLPQVGSLGSNIVAKAGLGLLALLVIASLSVYKPWGRTPYGKRKRRELRQPSAQIPDLSGALTLFDPVSHAVGRGLPTGLKVLLAGTGVLVVMLGILHHAGHILHHLH